MRKFKKVAVSICYCAFMFFIGWSIATIIIDKTNIASSRAEAAKTELNVPVSTTDKGWYPMTGAKHPDNSSWGKDDYTPPKYYEEPELAELRKLTELAGKRNEILTESRDFLEKIWWKMEGKGR